MADLSTHIQFIKGIGPQRAKSLQKLGIETLRDLISWLPRRYEDRTEFHRIADLVPGESACVAAMVASTPTVAHVRKGMDLVKVRAVDESGTLDVTFFNQTWLKSNLHQGETYVFYGRAEGNLLRRQMASPVVEPLGRPHRAHLSPDRRGQPVGAVPVHPPGAGRLRRHPAGCATGRGTPGPPPVPH